MSFDLKSPVTQFEIPKVVAPVAAPEQPLPAVAPAQRATVSGWDRIATSVPHNLTTALAGSAWLTTLVVQCLSGTNSILLASTIATGVLGSAALTARHGATIKATSTEQTEAHLRYAMDPALTDRQRVKHAYEFTKHMSVITAKDAHTLLEKLPTGTDWGFNGGPARQLLQHLHLLGGARADHLKTLKALSLGKWTSSAWNPNDIEVVFYCLTKIPAASDAEKKDLIQAATRLIKGTHEYAKHSKNYSADLAAAVNELVRRLPTNASEPAPPSAK